MPKYVYKCEFCDFLYTETRDINQPQIFIKCSCGSNYIEVTE